MDQNIMRQSINGDTLIKIAHRGNVYQPSKLENHPQYIKDAIHEGYDVELDLWHGNRYNLALGHDEPIYEITKDFLLKYGHRLWIHCKNINALLYMRGNLPDLNYFFHDSDDVTLTSKGFLWHYKGKGPYGHHSICVLPEPNHSLPICYGICSDYVGL